MISLTAQYALRALVLIAQNDANRPVLASQIAQRVHVPRQYLSVVLRQAVRSGFLKSTRGRGGGFVLARPAAALTLAEILEPYDRLLAVDACPFGLSRCNDNQSCPIHNHWKPVATAYRRMLKETTLADLLKGPAGRHPRRSKSNKATRKPARRGKQRD